jgi:hypothetical protein
MQGSRSARLNVCRMHGAGGGALKRRANGSYEHGLYTKETKAERRPTSELLQRSRRTIAIAGD